MKIVCVERESAYHIHMIRVFALQHIMSRLPKNHFFQLNARALAHEYIASYVCLCIPRNDGDDDDEDDVVVDDMALSNYSADIVKQRRSDRRTRVSQTRTIYAH